MKKATLAKIAGGVAAVALLVQGFITSQGSLAVPHDLNGWLKILTAFGVYAAAHHASNTGGSN